MILPGAKSPAEAGREFCEQHVQRAGFDELVREWLRLAEQAEWIEAQQRPPPAKRITRQTAN